MKNGIKFPLHLGYIWLYFACPLIDSFGSCNVLYWVQANGLSNDTTPTRLKGFKNFNLALRRGCRCQNERVYKFKPRERCGKFIHQIIPIIICLRTKAGENLACSLNQNLMNISIEIFIRFFVISSTLIYSFPTLIRFNNSRDMVV